MIYDQAAQKILLGRGTEAQKQSALARLARHASDRLENREECPECGDSGPHDDNGRTGEERSLCCRMCGNHWDVP
jgi:hypothetical protein